MIKESIGSIKGTYFIRKAVFHQREGTFLWCLWFKFEPDAISDVTSNPRWNWVGRSRSSLVFKQPTISILPAPNIERWMVETRYKWMLIFMENNVTPLNTNISKLILLGKWSCSFLIYQIYFRCSQRNYENKSRIFWLGYFLAQYQLLTILLLQKQINTYKPSLQALKLVWNYSRS